MKADFNVAIIGTGFGGLSMAMQCQSINEQSFVIFEKANGVGGTWRDNTYPGAACDVESHLYWFSRDKQPDWSRIFPLQEEILTSLNSMVEERGLRKHIRFNTEVKAAQWDDDEGFWRIALSTGQTVTARSLVAAWGQLNRPSTKGIQGVESFKGQSFHSARWDHSIDLKGKRVACIGNRPSAAQFIPEVAKVAGQCTVFQRSAAYVVPRNDRAYDKDERYKFSHDHDERQKSRKYWYEYHESWIPAFVSPGHEVAVGFTALAKQHLETQVQDPAIREKLWPDYALGCKRVVISDDYYPAFNQSNVELVTDAIDRVETTGVRTTDGKLREFDVIIYGTGFETLSFLGPVEIRGRNGISLRDRWQGVPKAYLGMTIPGFPNFFYLYGPNTNLGHNSIIEMIECQTGYITEALKAINANGGRPLEIKEEAFQKFNEELQHNLKSSVWALQCYSWYKTPEGNITNNWSSSVEDYRKATANFDVAKYQFLKSPEARATH